MFSVKANRLAVLDAKLDLIPPGAIRYPTIYIQIAPAYPALPGFVGAGPEGTLSHGGPLALFTAHLLSYGNTIVCCVSNWTGKQYPLLATHPYMRNNQLRIRFVSFCTTQGETLSFRHQQSEIVDADPARLDREVSQGSVRPVDHESMKLRAAQVFRGERDRIIAVTDHDQLGPCQFPLGDDFLDPGLRLPGAPRDVRRPAREVVLLETADHLLRFRGRRGEMLLVAPRIEEAHEHLGLARDDRLQAVHQHAASLGNALTVAHGAGAVDDHVEKLLLLLSHDPLAHHGGAGDKSVGPVSAGERPLGLLQPIDLTEVSDRPHANIVAIRIRDYLHRLGDLHSRQLVELAAHLQPHVFTVGHVRRQPHSFEIFRVEVLVILEEFLLLVSQRFNIVHDVVEPLCRLLRVALLKDREGFPISPWLSAVLSGEELEHIHGLLERAEAGELVQLDSL